jgi:hypothetical protein
MFGREDKFFAPAERFLLRATNGFPIVLPFAAFVVVLAYSASQSFVVGRGFHRERFGD